MGKKFSKSAKSAKHSFSSFSNFSNNNINNEENEIEIANTTEFFRYVDGRRYHNVPNLRYHLPNDGDEFDRLQMQHYLSRYIWQSNYSAPVHELLKNGGKGI